ncbi:MAG TPA: metalloregulator ArsR/SmtB family transcription factor [Polyangiaceae bacterium]
MTSDVIFRALGDPTRRSLFERLVAAEGAVGDLGVALGVSQPAVSQHLAVLRAAKLVTMRQAGRQRFYRARPEGLAPLFDWLTHYQKFWPEKLESLKAMLKKRGEK